MKKGCKYGTHRVIEPKGVLPQAAQIIDNNMEIYDNEILIDVKALNIDSASFTQLKQANNNNDTQIGRAIIDIVSRKGKMQNPVTGSGGMLIGTVEKIGEKQSSRTDLKVGDQIATMVSLSLTPLRIDKITKIHMDIDRVEIEGKAILFESGIYAKLPEDMDERLALAALDVAGAPAQTAKLVNPGDIVLIIGANGKSGMLCCYEAMKRVGPDGKVIGLVRTEKTKNQLISLGLCHDFIIEDAKNSMNVYNCLTAITKGRECDLAINCVNIPDTEMSTILPVRDGGLAYFFSMATSFTKAALGAEGIGKDVTMIMGNGYTKGHAETTLSILRENEALRNLYEKKYVR
ncbi:MAG: L-erythro-3,5-diaminohexanoate dehydrogenase [Spirochaetales bacterium]|nr:L-erythro-3,5-diaminohexanoate dehydrogenase [Spirochaetales bacterium]